MPKRTHPHVLRDLPHVLKTAGRTERAIIAVVAGSGLVARSARDGDADLLMVLSAGYFRNLGAGSLASLMPYANSNDLTERLLTEQILPCSEGTPVIAGVCPTDPIRPVSEVLQRFASLGVKGITNWPAMGFIDGVFGQLLKAEGVGVDAEVALLKEAKQHGLAAFGFALDADTALCFAKSGADALILDLGLTRQLDDVRERGDHIQRAIVRLQAMLAAVESSGCRPLLLCFGGPIVAPEDLDQIYRQCEIDGFAGGSVFERLPVHEAITTTVRRFKSTPIHSHASKAETGFGELIGQSRAMKDVFRIIRQVAPHDANVCIEGETGTGKELAATLLHRHSARSRGPLITLNCGAIPEPLLESELFGHEKGAFTGAHRQRMGKFELAHGGTLFLDEIGDLSPHGQVALLRAIQQREITRVGGDSTIPVDVRIISASHQSLAQLIREKKFREDLFYRLNHISIHMPSLRERMEDLRLLSDAIVERLKVQLNRKAIGLSQRFIEKLESHAWPGNIRELEHVLHQSALLEDSLVLTGRHFTPSPHSAEPSQLLKPSHADPRASGRLAETAREAIVNAHGNKSRAAAQLGISRKTLYAWLRADATP
jgi:DNA-binding NtrC family response regulator/predicted TIM-barrel enzyme